jgi:hypothetical protein
MLQKLINKVVSFFETVGEKNTGTEKSVPPAAPYKVEPTPVNPQITDSVTQAHVPEVTKSAPAKKRQFPKKVVEEKKVPVPRKKTVKKTE